MCIRDRYETAHLVRFLKDRYHTYQDTYNALIEESSELDTLLDMEQKHSATRLRQRTAQGNMVDSSQDSAIVPMTTGNRIMQALQSYETADDLVSDLHEVQAYGATGRLPRHIWRHIIECAK